MDLLIHRLIYRILCMDQSEVEGNDVTDNNKLVKWSTLGKSFKDVPFSVTAPDIRFYNKSIVIYLSIRQRLGINASVLMYKVILNGNNEEKLKKVLHGYIKKPSTMQKYFSVILEKSNNRQGYIYDHFDLFFLTENGGKYCVRYTINVDKTKASLENIFYKPMSDKESWYFAAEAVEADNDFTSVKNQNDQESTSSAEEQVESHENITGNRNNDDRRNADVMNLENILEVTDDNEVEWFELNNDLSYSETDVDHFMYFENIYDIDGWAQFYQQLAMCIYGDYPNILNMIKDDDTDEIIGNDIVSVQNKERSEKIIGKNIYINVEHTPDEIVDKIFEMAELCNFDIENIKVSFRSFGEIKVRNEINTDKSERDESEKNNRAVVFDVINEKMTAMNIELKYFIYKGSIYEVSNWRDLYYMISKCLFENHREIFARLKKEPSNSIIRNDIRGTFDFSEMKSPEKLGPGFYLETAYDPEMILLKIIEIMTLCDTRIDKVRVAYSIVNDNRIKSSLDDAVNENEILQDARALFSPPLSRTWSYSMICPRSFVINGYMYAADSWSELYVGISKYFYRHNKKEVYSLLDSNTNYVLGYDFQSSNVDMKNPRKITENLYLETGYDENTIVRKIMALMDLCNVASADLDIYYTLLTAETKEEKDEAVAVENDDQKAKENSAVKRVPWNKYEAAILMNGYVQILEGRKRHEVIDEISVKLRKMAEARGLTIDDKYRNANGIELQMSSLEYSFTDGEKGLAKPTALFRDIVDLYRHDHTAYMKILFKANQMVAEEKQLYVNADNESEKDTDSIAIANDGKSMTDTEHVKSANIMTVDFLSMQEYKYTAPVTFVYFGKRYKEQTWKELYVQFMKCFYEDYPTIVNSLVNINISRGRRPDLVEASGYKKLKAPARITDKLYLETNNSAETIVHKIKQLMDMCYIDYENIIIHYRNLDNKIKKISDDINQIDDSDKCTITCLNKVEVDSEHGCEDKKAASNYEPYKNILRKYFKRGIRNSSILDMNRFYKLWEDEYNEDLSVDKSIVKMNISHISILMAIVIIFLKLW